MTPLVSLQALAKRHGPARALRGVDLDMTAGECVALLGPNGAGKTTLLRLMAGIARPSSGEILLDGKPASACASAWRARVGHVSHHLMLHESLTVRENLAFAASLHALPHARAQSDRILRTLGLHERADEPVRQLSRGLAQRAAVARALLHDPEILLLDEPFTGLDHASAGALVTLLQSLRRRGRLLVLVTHDLSVLPGLATRVVHLRHGRVAGDVAADGLQEGDMRRIVGGDAVA